MHEVLDINISSMFEYAKEYNLSLCEFSEWIEKALMEIIRPYKVISINVHPRSLSKFLTLPGFRPGNNPQNYGNFEFGHINSIYGDVHIPIIWDTTLNKGDIILRAYERGKNYEV